MSTSNHASINARVAALTSAEFGRRKPVVSIAAPAADSGQRTILSRSERCIDSTPPSSDSDDDEVASGVATGFPEESVQKNGVRVRNYVVTYYPGGERPIYIDEMSAMHPEHYVQYMLKPTHKQFTFYSSCLEVAPSTKRLHGHMYIELKEGQTITWLKNQLGTTHIKAFARKGTQKQARDYVYKVAQYSQKDYTCLANVLMSFRMPDVKPYQYSCIHPYSYGTMKAQGARSDLDRFVDYAMNGTTHKEFLIAEQGSGLRYFKYFNDATEVFDGTHRSATIRANKRFAYDNYVASCDKEGVVPMPYYEFTMSVDPDAKWSAGSIAHESTLVALAIDQKANEEDEELQAIKNKLSVHGGKYRDPKDTTKKNESESDSDSDESQHSKE